MKQIPRIIILVMALVVLSPRLSHAQATAVLENPAQGQVVSGLGPISGWAFNVLLELATPVTVALLVDGQPVSVVPCCVQRADVAAAFGPQALNSGFGQNFNFNILAAGQHRIGVEIRDVLGTPLLRRESAVTVVKPGGFEFLSELIPQSGELQIVNQTIVFAARIRETGTSTAQVVTLGLTWIPSAQALGIISATSTSGAASTQSTQQAAAEPRLRAQAAMNNDNITAELENPPNTTGATVSGIGITSGWAFSTVANGTISSIQLRADGTPPLVMNIPCCAPRADVRAANSSFPQSLLSGFGAPFNFNLLASGAHTIAVEIRDAASNVEIIERPVTAVKLANAEFLDQFLFTANTRAGTGAQNQVFVNRVQVRDKATQVTQEITAAFVWERSCQCFVARPFCGNASVEGAEECDGATLNGTTCEKLGFSGGTLSCRASCEFETNQCTGGPSLFVTNAMDNTVSVISPATNTVTKTLRVGKEPRGVAVTPNKGAVYVTNFRSDTVSVLSANPPVVVGTIPVGDGPTGVTFSPNGALAYVVNGLDDSVSVINVATSAVITTVPVGPEPQEIAVTPDGTLGYVTHSAGASVGVINLATNLAIAVISVGAGPSGIAVTPDGTKIFVANTDDASVSIIDRATGTVKAVIVGLQPARIIFSADGKMAFVTNFLDNSLSVIDTTALTVSNPVILNNNALGLALATGGKRTYLTFFGREGFGNSVGVINTATGLPTDEIRVGDGPLGIAGTP